jgi:hypothetical protein
MQWSLNLYSVSVECLHDLKSQMLIRTSANVTGPQSSDRRFPQEPDLTSLATPPLIPHTGYPDAGVVTQTPTQWYRFSGSV